MAWKTSYYHYDAVGSTRGLTGSDQNFQVFYPQLAFGQKLTPGDAIVNPFRFVGQVGYYFDTVSGLFQVRQRVYDANLSRWLSQDPAKSDLNLMRYVHNSPLFSADPNGLERQDPDELLAAKLVAYYFALPGKGLIFQYGWGIDDEFAGIVFSRPEIATWHDRRMADIRAEALSHVTGESGEAEIAIHQKFGPSGALRIRSGALSPVLGSFQGARIDGHVKITWDKKKIQLLPHLRWILFDEIDLRDDLNKKVGWNDPLAKIGALAELIGDIVFDKFLHSAYRVSFSRLEEGYYESSR